LADRIENRAAALAVAEGIQIEFWRKKVRKKDRVQQLLAQRGGRPGPICILSAMEKCDTYRLCKKEKGWGLRPDSGKCLHYYFYFLDPEWGLGFLRLPTWAPFRVQFYVNGHSWLALQLKPENIAYRLLDNASGGSRRLATRPAEPPPKCAWTNSIVNWMTGRSATARSWPPCTGTATGASIQPSTPPTWSSEAQHIATFLGKKLNTSFQGEAGNRYDVRIQGTRIKHTMGPVSIKMYDKFGRRLRIRTTVNDLTFFQHYRQVEQRDG
jgi:hypothetical protein